MQRLDASTAPRYAALTYPTFRRWLEDPAYQDRAVAVGYSFWGRPLGLALGAAGTDPHKKGQVISLFVDPTCRRQGLGAALLARLEQELIARTAERAFAFYPGHRPMTPVVEHLFTQAGWAPPTPRTFTCRCRGADVGRMAQAPWMNPPSLPEGFELFPWAELRPDERDALEREQQEYPFAEPTLWPFLSQVYQWDPVGSLGLRYDGAVVGWMLTRRAGDATINFSKLFVRHGFRATGRAVVLMTEAIKRHVAHDGHHPRFEGAWEVAADNAPMVRFLRRRLTPYLTSMTETYCTSKTLMPPSTEGARYPRAARPAGCAVTA